MYFLLTIDVEEDNQWNNFKKNTLRNVYALPNFQQICDFYGIKPTYLVTYGVSKNVECQKILSTLNEEGNCEIGSHLHPWTTPPYRKPYTKMAYPHAYPSELPTDLLERKITKLTNSIKIIRGTLPKSYRAGRYGLDERSVKILMKLGYVVDSSVTPLYDWSHHRGTTKCGPNFTSASYYPYLIDTENILRSFNHTKNILEVPITIRKMDANYYWLRPFPSYKAQNLLDLCNYAMKEEGNYLLNMMFHSSELSPGCSPYVKSTYDLHYFIQKLRKVFGLISEKGLKCITLANFRNDILKYSCDMTNNVLNSKENNID